MGKIRYFLQNNFEQPNLRFIFNNAEIFYEILRRLKFLSKIMNIISLLYLNVIVFFFNTSINKKKCMLFELPFVRSKFQRLRQEALTINTPIVRACVDLSDRGGRHHALT